MLKNILKKNPRITFEFEPADGGFIIHSKVEGEIMDQHIYGLQRFIQSRISESEKKSKNGKNRRK